MNTKLLSVGLLALSLVACYSPDPFEAEVDSGSNESSDIGTVYAINKGEQTCNPSVSQDTVNFPGSMLWLNFTRLNLKAPDSGFTMTGIEQHDRLTISDTSNKVKWYLMRDTSKGECQFQDPEWSTHPDYIVALRAYDTKGGSCDPKYLDYGIFAVRTLDKQRFWFIEDDILEEATPHLWVDPLAKAPEEVDDSSVEGFFGTDNVRLTYVDGTSKPLNIIFIDYAKGGKPVKLKRPEDRGDWQVDSPLISPDGKFVVYNLIENSRSWEAYIQELSENSTPILIEQTKDMMSAPAQPHWFKYDDRLFVIWAEFPSGSPMLNKNDLTNVAAQDGSVGRTVMREIRLSAGAPVDFAVEWVGENRVVATVPMTGGRSPDAKFLATGTNPAYILQLP